MRGIAALAAVLAFAQPALAATSLCVEEQSSGYVWRDGTWLPATYSHDSYIVKPIMPDDPLGYGCHNRIKANGHPTEADPGAVFMQVYGCYTAYLVGDAPSEFDVSMCMQYWHSGVLTVISCASEGAARYEFEPNGEFLYHRTYAVRVSRTTNAERDSLVLSVGKCSVIEP